MIKSIDIDNHLSYKQNRCDGKNANQYIEHIRIHTSYVSSTLHLILSTEHFSCELIGKSTLVVVGKGVAIVCLLLVLLGIWVFIGIAVVKVGIVVTFTVLVHIGLTICFVQNGLEFAFLDRGMGTLTGSLRMLYASLIYLNFYENYGLRSGWYFFARE